MEQEEVKPGGGGGGKDRSHFFLDNNTRSRETRPIRQKKSATTQVTEALTRLCTVSRVLL